MANKKDQERIEELELLLEQKETEINTFKSELSKLNVHIENLIDKLKTQLKIAHKIQEKLIPTEFPNIPGFEFSTKFQASHVSGGDYFDIFEIEDRFRFSILLSSCSGYGISSLFLSVLLQLTSHIETKKGAPPEKVFTSILKELLPQISEEDTANLFYALINRRNYEMSYCHYGNNLIFHYDVQNKNLLEIEPAAGPLKKDFDHKIVSGSIHLNPKDCLILLSEGVLRVKDKHGVTIGRSQIKNIIEQAIEKPTHQIRNEIFFQLQKISGKKEYDKDVTVLVAEVKDKVLKLA